MTAARLTLLAVAVCLVCSSFTLAGPSSRIWGGDDVIAGATPWVVSVRVDATHTCCGSLISNRHILCAASCVAAISTTPVSPNATTVRAGSINQYAGGEIINVESIDIHPSFGNFMNNLAILTLARPVIFSDKIKAIPLATSEEDPVAGDVVTVDGWGLQEGNQSPYKLQRLESTIVARGECEYGAGFGYEQCLCLSSPVGKGICNGDAGAGVVRNEKLVAVASFAFGGCGTNYYDISTKVSYFLSWIESIIA